MVNSVCTDADALEARKAYMKAKEVYDASRGGGVMQRVFDAVSGTKSDHGRVEEYVRLTYAAADQVKWYNDWENEYVRKTRKAARRAALRGNKVAPVDSIYYI